MSSRLSAHDRHHADGRRAQIDQTALDRLTRRREKRSPGRIAGPVAVCLRRQGVVATTSLIFSNGVIQLRVSRGRRLS
jgi:hypothetical protein